MEEKGDGPHEIQGLMQPSLQSCHDDWRLQRHQTFGQGNSTGGLSYNCEFSNCTNWFPFCPSSHETKKTLNSSKSRLESCKAISQVASGRTQSAEVSGISTARRMSASCKLTSHLRPMASRSEIKLTASKRRPWRPDFQRAKASAQPSAPIQVESKTLLWKFWHRSRWSHARDKCHRPAPVAVDPKDFRAELQLMRLGRVWWNMASKRCNAICHALASNVDPKCRFRMGPKP